MIELITAKSGGRVIRWRGRLLASRVDPEGEARCWFQRRVAFISKVKSIFILGAGSGFHIAETARRTQARILVIDRCPELIREVQAQMHEFGDRVRFIEADSARALRANSEVRSAVSASFVVLEHPATISLDKEFFNECSAQLIGRDWGTLNWQWQLKSSAALDAQTKISSSDAPLTIYDLEQTELVQDSEERERMLLKALRELVK